MNDFVIETKHLTKVYGEQTAVDKVNLHVRKGRIYGLLGRNGAGKTNITTPKNIMVSIIVLLLCLCLSAFILRGTNRIGCFE